MFEPFCISVRIERSLRFFWISFLIFAFQAGSFCFLPMRLCCLGFKPICSVITEAVAYTIWFMSVIVSGPSMPSLISLMDLFAVSIASGHGDLSLSLAGVVSQSFPGI